MSKAAISSGAAGARQPMRPFHTRAVVSELLDRDTVEPDELARNLRDLARLNRLPGGVATSTVAIDHLVGTTRDVRVLDVGTGIADMPVTFAARRGWTVTAVDAHRQVVDEAAAATHGNARVEVVQADARALPFDDGTYDVAHCSLLLHHLEPGDASVVLREMSRVARHGIVINDLRRGLLPFVATGVAVAVLGRCRATRVDGIASVRRAYTLAELDALLARARLRATWRSRPLMPRVVTAAVPV